MLARNMGSIDRGLRLVLGVVLLALFFIDADASWRWAYLIGIVPVLTAVAGSCPLYSLVGISTCPRQG